MVHSRSEVNHLFITEGRVFIDDQFPPSRESIFASDLIDHSDHNESCCNPQVRLERSLKKYGVDDITWRRPTLHDRLYDAKGPEVMDIKQGYLGNCWLMSAVAALSRQPGFIRKVILNEHASPSGCYEIRFCVNGVWQTALIDDHFPVDKHSNPIFARHMNKTFWVALIEKAMAKLVGCYEKLSGGHVGRTLSMLTGSVNISIYLGSMSSKKSKDRLWLRMKAYHETGFIMTASTRDSSENAQNQLDLKGAHLFPAHVYTILELYDNEGRDGRILRVITVRNPHSNACADFYSYGSYGYEEPCSASTEKERKTREMARRALDDRKFVDFDKFQELFDVLEICKVRVKVFEARIHFPLDTYYETGLYSCMTIEIEDESEIDVLIHQNYDHKKCQAMQNLVDLCLVIFLANRNSDAKSLIAGNLSRSASVRDLSVSGEFRLSSGTWIIFPISCLRLLAPVSEDSTTMEQFRTSLVVHSCRNFKANLMRPPRGLIADVVHCMRIKEGYLIKQILDIQLYLMDSLAGTFVIARNLSETANYTVKLRYRGTWRSTRGRNTKDHISSLC